MNLHGSPRADRCQSGEPLQWKFGPPLTAVGEAMAQAFAQAYASLKWDAIYTSPMLRARQTADALCRLTGVQATVEDGLKEIDYGEWEGLRQDEVKERWPEAFEYWADDVTGAVSEGEGCPTHFRWPRAPCGSSKRSDPDINEATCCSSRIRRPCV